MTYETDKRKQNKISRQKQYVYIVHVYSVWDCDGHGDSLTESKVFDGTDAGWAKATKYMKQFSDRFWNVTLVKSRRKT